MFDTLNYQRLLPKLAIVMIFATITGVLAGTLAVGLFYAAYLLMVRHGLDADLALLVISVGITVAMAISAILTASHIRKLRHALQPFSPLASSAYDIAGAFMDGLRTPSIHKSAR